MIYIQQYYELGHALMIASYVFLAGGLTCLILWARRK